MSGKFSYFGLLSRMLHFRIANETHSWGFVYALHQGYLHPHSGALQYGNCYWPLHTRETHSEPPSSLQGMLSVNGLRQTKKKTYVMIMLKEQFKFWYADIMPSLAGSRLLVICHMHSILSERISIVAWCVFIYCTCSWNVYHLAYTYTFVEHKIWSMVRWLQN